jgi:RNA recognition motif-containing protein
LENLFKDCGKVVQVRIPEDRFTRKSKGFAFVVMENEKAAKKALNYDGHRVMNRPLKVRLADPLQDAPSRFKIDKVDAN